MTENAVAGFSGGRSSARMLLELDLSVVITFQNTGREHSKTLDFIARVEDWIQRPVIRLEFRAPPRGEPPKHAEFEVVDHDNLDRRGGPFRDMLECLKSFRNKHKGLGPVAPWARQRICTAHLKIKTQRRYCASLGWGTPRDYVEYLGLRADEPHRLSGMRQRNQLRDTDERAPLAEQGIVREDVLRYWSRQPFDLEIPDYLGNCTGCFLKDEGDLARALLDPETDPEWWIAIERDYAPMRRGRSSYRQVLAEAPARMRIREAIERGEEPRRELPERRHKLVVAQERRKPEPWSCECDAARSDLDD